MRNKYHMSKRRSTTRRKSLILSEMGGNLGNSGYGRFSSENFSRIHIQPLAYFTKGLKIGKIASFYSRKCRVADPNFICNLSYTPVAPLFFQLSSQGLKSKFRHKKTSRPW